MVEGRHDAEAEAEAEEAYTRGLRLLESLITGHKRKVRGYRTRVWRWGICRGRRRGTSYQGTHRFAPAHLTETITHAHTHARTHHIRMARNGNTPFR